MASVSPYGNLTGKGQIGSRPVAADQKTAPNHRIGFQQHRIPLIAGMGALYNKISPGFFRSLDLGVLCINRPNVSHLQIRMQT